MRIRMKEEQYIISKVNYVALLIYQLQISEHIQKSLKKDMFLFFLKSNFLLYTVLFCQIH